VRRSALVVLLALARPAAAQPEVPPSDPKDQAESLYKEGAKQYDLREYATAIDDFKRAYALFPEATILFDIAQAYRMLHDCDNATAFYRNYVRDKPDGEDRDEALKRAQEMDACAADQRQQREAAARAQPVIVAPVVVENQPRHRGLKIAGIVTAAVGAAIAGTAVYFSVDAADKAHDLEQACMLSCMAGDVSSIDQAGQTSQDRAVALYIIGGSALAIGTGLFVWATLHAGSETVRVAPTPGGATLSTSFQF
jgi:tetratricopeptide (TPR) repeat protein